MRSILLLFIILKLSFSTSAQWIQKASFTGGPRTKAVSFQIGNNIYLMGGINAAGATLRDLWEYNISTDSWIQKSDFAGPERYGAVAFVINNIAFVATGGNDNGYLDDLWQYNSITDTWSQRTGLPAGSAQHENQRRESYAFVINNKAYLGGGDGFVFSPNSTSNIAFYDLWEFDPASNSWTQKADIPDFIGRDMSIAAAINNKAYVGLGCNVQQNLNRQSFWEYDPANDTWTSKANFPTLFTTDANALVIDSQLYVVGGVNLNPVSLSSQIYRYDNVSDTWIQMPSFTGGAIAGAISISTDSSAFIGTGYTGNLNLRTDLWEFSTLNTGIIFPTLESNHTLHVFPNPFSNSTKFEILNDQKNSTLEIFDACGKKVKQMELNNENSSFYRGNLENGIYFYLLTFESRTIDRGKLIIE